MRSIDVGGNVKGRDLGSVAADVEAAVDEQSISRSNTIRNVIGEYAERQTAVETSLERCRSSR